MRGKTREKEGRKKKKRGEEHVPSPSLRRGGSPSPPSPSHPLPSSLSSNIHAYRQFINKYLRNGYGNTEESNIQIAGKNFFVLLNKLLQAGK